MTIPMEAIGEVDLTKTLLVKHLTPVLLAMHLLKAEVHVFVGPAGIEAPGWEPLPEVMTDQRFSECQALRLYIFAYNDADIDAIRQVVREVEKAFQPQA